MATYTSSVVINKLFIVEANGSAFTFLNEGAIYYNSQSYNSFEEGLDEIAIIAISIYGSFSYVRTEDATNVYFAITIVDTLNPPPPPDGNGIPVAIGVQGMGYLGTAFVSYTFELPPTPPADLTICTECRQSRQQACADTYLITAGLTEGDTYYVTITDRNNNLYIQSIVADVDGNLTIDALSSEFPNGFWLSESGTKSIIVYEDVNRTIVADLTVGANVYTCMILTLQYIYTTT